MNHEQFTRYLKALIDNYTQEVRARVWDLLVEHSQSSLDDLYNHMRELEVGSQDKARSSANGDWRSAELVQLKKDIFLINTFKELMSSADDSWFEQLRAEFDARHEQQKARTLGEKGVSSASGRTNQLI